MKITTFNPQIITKNAEPLVALFKELGFEKCHNQEGIGEMDVTGIRMKYANLIQWSKNDYKDKTGVALVNKSRKEDED